MLPFDIEKKNRSAMRARREKREANDQGDTANEVERNPEPTGTHQFTLSVPSRNSQRELRLFSFLDLQVVEVDSSLGSREMGRGRRVDDSRKSFRFVGRREEEREKNSGEMVVSDDVASKLKRINIVLVRKNERRRGGMRANRATCLKIYSMLRQRVGRRDHDSSAVEEDIQVSNSKRETGRRGSARCLQRKGNEKSRRERTSTPTPPLLVERSPNLPDQQR